MPFGPGKYGQALEQALGLAGANTGVLIVFDGTQGEGFTSTLTAQQMLSMPATLRTVAAEIENESGVYNSITVCGMADVWAANGFEMFCDITGDGESDALVEITVQLQSFDKLKKHELLKRLQGKKLRVTVDIQDDVSGSDNS